MGIFHYCYYVVFALTYLKFKHKKRLPDPPMTGQSKKEIQFLHGCVYYILPTQSSVLLLLLMTLDMFSICPAMNQSRVALVYPGPALLAQDLSSARIKKVPNPISDLHE